MNRNRDFEWGILVFIIVLILLLRFFVDIRLYGHDTLFHIGNIINLSKTISFSNLFGDDLVSFSLNSFGYGTWFFYPKLPHLLGAYGYLIFKNIYFSMGIVYFITTFLSGMMIYFLSKKLFNCSRVAFLSSLIYLTFSYHICEIYTRDAYAENFMFFVIPMIFLGLYELKDENYNKFYVWFILGYVIGMYSHLISMLFCTIFVFLFLLYYRKNFFCKQKLKSLLVSTLIVSGLLCPFLIKILEHKLLGNYVVFTENFSSRNIVISNILSLKSYFIHNKNFNYNNIIIYFNYSTVVLFIITFITYFFRKTKNKFKDKRKFLLSAILVLVLFISSKYFWQYAPNILTMIQFSWRLMVFLCCVISLYAPLCFFYKIKRRKIYYLGYFVVVFVMILEGFNNIFYYGKEEYSFDEIVQSGNVMGWQFEYLPVSVIEQSVKNYGDYLKHREYQFILNDLSVDLNVLDDKFPTIKFEVSNVVDSLYVEFPRIYYLGYELHHENGQKNSLFQTDYGFLGTEIIEDGVYTLNYVGTIYDKISNVIFWVTILVLSIWGGWFVWKKKRLQF